MSPCWMSAAAREQREARLEREAEARGPWRLHGPSRKFSRSLTRWEAIRVPSGSARSFGCPGGFPVGNVRRD